MKCPICGDNVNDMEPFCPSCGADMGAFAKVTPDKVIYNQTPQEQQAVGDDSVTELIPENYMQTSGDDGVTELIPENYMTAQGDDSVTELIPENYMQVQPQQQFANTGYNVQPRQQFSNQGGYVQPAPKGGLIFGVLTLIALVITLVSGIIYITDPVFYVFQSFCGGEIPDSTIRADLMTQNGYENVKDMLIAFTVVSMVLIVISIINSVVTLMRTKARSIKRPLASSIGAFITGLLGVGIITVLKVVLYLGVMEERDEERLMMQFNIMDLYCLFGVIAAIMLFINIFVSVKTYKK